MKGLFAWLPAWLLAWLLVIPAAYAAADGGPPPPPTPTSGFTNPKEDARYHTLLKSLRCLVCQNESLQDSQAGLAQDLRREVRDQMRAGKSNPDIVKYLVSRYGDFVLYRPPLMGTTYLLWFGPFLALIAGIVALAVLLRRRTRRPDPDPLPAGERHRLAALLRGREEGPKP